MSQPKHVFTELATSDVRRKLAQLQTGDVAQYREAMQGLGAALAKAAKVDVSKPMALVTTPEDADFLTRGFWSELGATRNAHLVCYWTERLPSAEVASVVQEFVSPSLPKRVETVVVLKSIVSSGCTVRANLEQFLLHSKSARIIIAAPVMLDGADEELRRQFSAPVNQHFEFLTFARDREKQNEVVVPGIGGWVYERLGLPKRSARSLPALIQQQLT